MAIGPSGLELKMSPLAPIVFFGWIPLTILFFLILKPHQAVLFSVIGGVLFLPTTGFALPGLPVFTKNSVIAIGLIIGGRISGQRKASVFHWSRYDIPMLVWCFCPIATSLVNSLGWYDGLAGAWSNIAVWGIPYLAGRIYFDNLDKLRDLCLGILIGGLLYMPLCLYEIRMSPQLSDMIYGFFAHDWRQHIRYGGWRPIVFMQHGLMVALWMAATATTAFWLWRSGDVRRLKEIPMAFIVIALTVTSVLCKSANGWVSLAVGCGAYFVNRSIKTSWPFRLLILFILTYILLRITGYLSGSDILSAAGHFFDVDRVGSLGWRVRQEDLFIEKTMESLLVGWGGFGRGWPRDPETGKTMIRMIDGLWLIVFNTKGVVGIVSLYLGMLTGPWLVFERFRNKILSPNFSMFGPILLGVLVTLFMLDCLFNAMVNPIYIIISGALVGWYSALNRGKT